MQTRTYNATNSPFVQFLLINQFTQLAIWMKCNTGVIGVIYGLNMDNRVIPGYHLNLNEVMNY